MLPIIAVPLVLLAATVWFISVGIKSGKTDPVGPYVPTSNPYRVGAAVLVCEDLQRPDMNWNGLVLRTSGDTMTVRDFAYPYATVDLEKMYVFPNGSVL
jgi:hypothetical protein